ncbi:MAG: hypothetical protein ABIX44_10330 [Cryobacterium sp.]
MQAAAEPAKSPELSWSDVPLLESTSAKQVTPAVPEGEFVVPGEETPPDYEIAPAKSDYVLPSEMPAPDAPEGFSAFTSDRIKSTEFTDTFENADGTKTLFTSVLPVNVKDDAGKWVRASTTPVPDGRGGEVVEDHPLNPQFAADASSEDAFAVSRDGFDLSFTPVGADSSRLGSVDGSQPVSAGDDTVEYADVFGDIDVRYEVMPGAVKETLILDHAPERGEATWSWRVMAGQGARPQNC